MFKTVYIICLEFAIGKYVWILPKKCFIFFQPLIDFPMLETDIKLESSILTPPREANDILGPPPSKCTKLAFTLPKDSKDNIIVTLPHNGVLAPKLNGSTVVNPVTLVPSNVLTAHNVKTTNGVVNSKVKIQPRPIAVAPPPKAASALPPTGEWWNYNIFPKLIFIQIY